MSVLHGALVCVVAVASGCVAGGVAEESSGALPPPPGEVAAPCDEAIALDTDEPLDLARAVGLCRIVDPEDASPLGGVLSSALTQADGASDTDPLLHGVVPAFGEPFAAPREGQQLVVLSTGTARRPGDPDGIDPNGYGYRNFDLESPYPSGFPKVKSGCPLPTSATANDSVRWTLRLRVPADARSLQLDFAFLSTDWPGDEQLCAPSNDVFAVLAGDAATNIATDPAKTPISVNAELPRAEGDLGGTWMDHGRGGATRWLRVRAPVVGGVDLEIAFVLWDSEDHGQDSFVLLDAFAFSPDEVAEPVTEQAP